MNIKSDLLTEPIFVGREAEIDELNACLASAIVRKGKTVFICGEAGTGKTRLVNEFLKTIQTKEIATIVGWCLSNASVPYFPFIEAFKKQITASNNEAKLPIPTKTRRELEIAAHALMKPVKKVKHLEKLSPKVWKDLTFTTVAEAIQTISERQPAILFFDDLHWADSASLALLHYISRVLASEKVLIIATFRSEELHPTPEGQPHSLVETIRLMRREDLLKEISLLNLSKPDVVKVAEHMAGGSLDPKLVTKLVADSQGNPLFVVESLRMLLENRQLVQQDGYFSLVNAELGIPAKVKDIILRRLDSLKPNQRRILELASVIGEKFDPTLLGVAVSLGTLETLEALNEISIATSLVYSDGCFYRFDHAKSREVLYGEIPSALRKEYHARIAQTLENMAKPPKEIPVNELAYHYAQAANEDKALHYRIAAGEDALAKFSNEEAANYFTYVLQTVPDTSQYSNERNKALEGLGDALFAKGLYENAGKAFEKLANSENGVIRLRSLRKAMAASQWRGDLNHALELASKAEKYAALDRLEYARLLVWRGRVVGFSGDAESALRDLEQSLRVFEEEYSLSDAAQALTEAAVYYATKGNVKKALATTRRAIALFQDLEDLRGQMETRMFEGGIFFSCGLYQEAFETYDKCTKIGEKLGAFNDLTMATLYNSLLLESTGNLKEALSMSLRTLEYSEKTDSPYLQFNNYQMLTRQYAKLGDVTHAEEFHTKLMKFFDMISRKGTKLAHAVAVYSSAVFFGVKEQWEQANSLFEESLQLLKSAVLSNLFEPIIKADYAICLSKQGRVIEARKLTEESQTLREALNSRFAPGEVQAFLIAKRETAVGEELEVRLDMINVSRSPTQLLGVESLIPSAFDVKLLPSQCKQQRDNVNLQGKRLPPFGAESVTLILQPKRAGIFNLTPTISYIETEREDNEKEVKSYEIEPLKIIVHPKITPDQPIESAITGPVLEFEFKTEAAKKTFDFLLSAFVQDYMRRRLPLEWSGWRTLMEIVKHTRVSRHSIYGDGRSRGRAISELEHRGLVEARIFPKERGRGGKITKIRVFHERQTIKRLIDQAISIPTGKMKSPDTTPKKNYK